jgi:N utilization substance protein B
MNKTYTRRKIREIILKILFALDINKSFSQDEILNGILLTLEVPENVKEFIKNIVNGIIKHKKEIDNKISPKLINWSISRLPIIDRNILRISVYELLYLNEIPHKVSINEAIELAKRYSTSKSPSFINGVLDSIYNEIYNSF